MVNPDENATKSADPSSKPQFHSGSDAPPPSLILEKLSEQHKQQRANILSKLHNEPASSHLRAYFERLEKGSPTWDIDTFIEGAKCLANLSGSERVKYYGKTLKGLHDANSFTELWNQTYPEQPITLWDQDIRRQCPPSWSSELRGAHWVLAYQGEAPLSQGLNELLQGPTTLDCGIFCQILPWMAIRYLVGDGFFNKFFKFEKGQFTLTQTWDQPMNDVGTTGSLLYPFYDDPLHENTTDGLESQTRIQTRTVFNHATYLAKHPGGVERLHNVTQIDGYNIIFDPAAPRNILSKTELEQRLTQVYNAPKNLADLEKVWLYTTYPHYVHPDFAPKNFGTLAKEAKEYADHTLGETEWKDSQVEREKEAHGLHLIFNFQRLISCLEETKDAYLNGAIDEDVLSRARKIKIARR